MRFVPLYPVRTTLAALLLVAAGCSSSTTTPAADPRLRVVNNGPSSTAALAVIFPDSEIDFGAVSAGATTSYKHAPRGVFGYAAFRFAIEGVSRIQPVIDWVGAAPMDGRAFTYVIDVDVRRSSQTIRLISVTRDE